MGSGCGSLIQALLIGRILTLPPEWPMGCVQSSHGTQGTGPGQRSGVQQKSYSVYAKQKVSIDWLIDLYCHYALKRENNVCLIPGTV